MARYVHRTHDVNITCSPPPPPPPRGKVLFGKFGKCLLRQVRKTSCKHCMRTTVGAQEHPGYSADATTPWQPCSVPPVVLDEMAPQTGRLPSEMVPVRTPPASPLTTLCSAKSQTGRGSAGWTRSAQSRSIWCIQAIYI